MTRPNLRIVPTEPAKPRQRKPNRILLKESDKQIAARIRKGIKPKRPIVVRELTRAKDEIWL